MVPGRTLAFQHGSASLGFKDGTQIPPVFTAHKDGYLKQGTANLCKASLLKPAALPACVCKMCGKGCLCAHQAVCVFACAPFLAGVYVSALIWQALLGCRQAGSWIMAPALLAGRAHLKQQQVENAFFFFFFSPLLSLVLSRMGYGSGPDWQELWKIWQVPLFPSHFVSPLTLCYYRLERGHIQDEKQVSQEKCESLYAFSWYQHQLPLSPSCPSPSLLTLHFCILSFFIVSFTHWLCSLSLCLFPLSPSLLSVYSWTA